MNKEILRMQMLAGLITESQYKRKLNENFEGNDLPNVDDEDIKNYILKNFQSFLDQCEVNDDEIRIPLDMDSENVDPKSEIEYNAFTELYGIEYNKLMGTDQEDDATDKLDHIGDIMLDILRSKFNKITLVPVN